jgi:hypothetical protein
METKFDNLCDVNPARESWFIQVRVIRLWKVYSVMRPDQLDSVEMVLIDQKVC